MFITKILSLFFMWQVVSVQAKSEESSLKIKEAEIPAEAKIINAIAKTYTTAKNKSTQEIHRIYSVAGKNASGEQGLASAQIADTLAKVKEVNDGKHKIISSLTNDTNKLVNNMIFKLQEHNQSSIKESLEKAQSLQFDLQSAVDETALASIQIEKEIGVNTSISSDLNLSNLNEYSKNGPTIETKVTENQDLLSKAINSGDYTAYEKYQDELVGKISNDGLVVAARGVKIDSLPTAVAGQGSPQIKKVNELQGKTNVDKSINSTQAGTSLSSSAVSTKPEAPFTEGKVVSGDFKVERPAYLLESFYRQIISDPEQSKSFEIVAHLKKLEDLISYKVTEVNETKLSRDKKHLEKWYYGFGASLGDLTNDAHGIKNIFNAKAALELWIGKKYSEELAALEAYYSPTHQQWTSNQIMGRQRVPRYNNAIAELNEKKNKKLLLLSTEQLNIYKKSIAILSRMFRLADNACPQGMAINRTWQHLGARMTEVRRNVCEDENGKGYLIKFEKMPLMFKHEQKEEGIVYLNAESIADSSGKFPYESGMKLNLDEFKCPETTNSSIFGKDSVVKFRSVKYEFNGEKKDSARFHPKDAVVAWKWSTYSSKEIANRERIGSCIPRESNMEYGIKTEAGIKFSRDVYVCANANKEIVVDEIIQNDRIDTEWKIGKTLSVNCAYNFTYNP